MPLAPAGRRGYADYQRLDNWDSDTLFSSTADITGAGVVTDFIDVSRYMCLAGFDTIGSGDATVILSWYADNAGAGFAGQRRFQLSSLIGNGAQYHLPNLGPWLRVEWDKISVANASHIVRLFGTNRVHPLELIPSHSVVIDRPSIPLAPGASDINYPTDYYAGPLNVWLSVPIAGWSVILKYLTSGDAWDFLDFRAAPSGNSTYQFVTPPGAWRIEVDASTTAAGSYFLTATPSTTGAT